VVERAVTLCDGETFSVDETLLPRQSNQLSGRQVSRAGGVADDKKEFAGRERKAIEAALTECQGRVSGSEGADGVLKRLWRRVARGGSAEWVGGIMRA